MSIIEYLRYTDSKDNNLITRVVKYIKNAQKYSDKSEYVVILNILKLYQIGEDNKETFNLCKQIIDSTPSISLIEDSFLKTDFLQELFDDILETRLFDAWCDLVDCKQDALALECLLLMNKINTNYSVLVSNMFLSDYYYGDENKDENPKLAYKYAKKAIDNVGNFEYDSEIPFHKQWVRAIVRLAVCYIDGYGTKQNAQKAYEYSSKAAELGDAGGYSLLALCYEEGLSVSVDKRKALDLLYKAKEAGHENVDKRIEEIEKDLGIKHEKHNHINKDKNTHDIFISYSRRDTNVVNEFVSLLDKTGYNIWIDRDGIESGDAFKSVIVDAIEDCQVVLFFASEASNSSIWTAKEIGVAVDSKKEIIPIKLDNSRYDKSVRLDLINIDFIDYSEPSNKQACKDKLLRTLKTKITPKNKSNLSYISEQEQEYISAYKDATEGDSTISDKERKMLDRIRKMYGITESRANELEHMVSNVNLSEDEQEYLEAYKEALSEGGISDKERRILDKLLKASGISKDRATIIEKMA